MSHKDAVLDESACRVVLVRWAVRAAGRVLRETGNTARAVTVSSLLLFRWFREEGIGEPGSAELDFIARAVEAESSAKSIALYCHDPGAL